MQTWGVGEIMTALVLILVGLYLASRLLSLVLVGIRWLAAHVQAPATLQPAGGTSYRPASQRPAQRATAPAVAAPQAVAPVVALPAPSPKLDVKPLLAWLQHVNQKPDEAPHTLIVGETGSGKTTLAELVAELRTDKIVILDMKWKPGKWGGAPAVPIDDTGEFTQLEQACQVLLRELQQRLVQMKQGAATFEPLTIIVEEMPTLVEECPGAKRLFKRMGHLGRELQMRVIGLSQSDRVKALGIDGEGDIRDNYFFLKLGDKAIERLPGAATMRRPAIMEWRRKAYAIDTTAIPAFPRQPIPASRWWKMSDTLAGTNTGTNGIGVVVPALEPVGAEAGTSEIPESRVKAIRELAAMGASRNQIAAVMPIGRAKALALIEQVLVAEQSEAQP